MKIERLERADDPRLADYRDVKDPEWLRERGAFLAEGRIVVRTLCEQRAFHVRSLLFTETALAALGPVLEQLPAETAGYVVSREILDAVAGVRFHQGCVAAVDVPAARDWRALAHDARHLVVLESVRDPDNVGAIFRSARAFGVDGVLLAPGCASPLYRKAVRTSMGASLCVPFAAITPWPQAVHELRDASVTVCALAPDADDTLPAHVCREKIAWLLGAEGEGLSTTARAAATRAVRIPISPAADSINVAIAAAIAMQRVYQDGTP